MAAVFVPDRNPFPFEELLFAVQSCICMELSISDWRDFCDSRTYPKSVSGVQIIALRLPEKMFSLCFLRR